MSMIFAITFQELHPQSDQKGACVAQCSFSDAVPWEPVSFSSCWQNSFETSDMPTQTPAAITGDIEAQTTFKISSQTQTDEIEAKTQVFDLDDATMANLAEFLGRVEPVVAQVLDMNSRSLSFDVLSDGTNSDSDPNHGNKITHCLRNIAGEEAISSSSSTTSAAVSVAWNSVGNAVAVAYAKVDDTEWWASSSGVAVKDSIEILVLVAQHLSVQFYRKKWNIDTIRISQNKPHNFIELESCATSLAYHPKLVSLLAIGMLNGDLAIADAAQSSMSRQEHQMDAVVNGSASYSHSFSQHNTDNGTDLGDGGRDILCSSPFVAESHTEPITTVQWISCHRATSNIITSSGDGKIILWAFHHGATTADPYLSLMTRICLTTSVIPSYLRPSIATSSQYSAAGTGIDLGVLSVAVSKSTMETTIYIGTEIGSICRCSFDRFASQSLISNGLDVIDMAYSPHSGPVHQIATSPHNDRLFCSCGTDGHLHIYHMHQVEPLFIIDTARCALTCVSFHSSRPGLIFVSAAKGSIFCYDITVSTSHPIAELSSASTETKMSIVRHLAVHPKRPHLLASACDDGTVRIWSLCQGLCRSRAGANRKLEEIISHKFSA
eukprot:gene5689-8983_t